MMHAGSVPTLADCPTWFLFAVLVPFGLAWGSFLNVVIHRVPRGENVAFPGSHCPACGASIRAWNNVPVLSYLLLRGKASCCGAKISPRYALVELLGGLLAAAVLQLIVLELPGETSLGWAALVFLDYFSVGLTLLALTFIDFEYMLLPDSLTLGGAFLGLVSAPVRGMSWVDSLIGGAAGFAIIYLPFDWLHRRLRGYPGMGLGDAKLLLLSGTWFGYAGALFGLFAGAVQATLVTFAVYFAKGTLEEPEAIVKEREELERAIAEAEGAEREELERERDLDPAMHEPEQGLAKARVPFGPFLALATLEYGLFERWGLGAALDALFHPFA
jgi:leader peptidase (prepilin peptidase)/N-methyltransferase